MNITYIILVFLILITCRYTKQIYEQYVCKTKDEKINEMKVQKRESTTESKQKSKEEISITKIDIQDKKKEKIISNSYNQLTKWLLNPKNTVVWDNINNRGNKVKITCRKPGQPIKISNIQIWGKAPNDTKSRNWTESDPRYGAVSVKLSSKKDDVNPIYMNKIKQVEGLYDSKTSSISCPENHQLTSCSCYSSQGTCNGSQIVKDGDNFKCEAYNRPGGFKIQAKAMCAQIDGNIDLHQKESDFTNEGNYASVQCDDETMMIGCNCVSNNNNTSQSCKGANIEKVDDKVECRAHRNSTSQKSDKIKAIASCAKIPGAKIRNTVQDQDEKPSVNGIATTMCKFDEKMIGCNCYAGTGDDPNKSKHSSICKGVTYNKNVCTAESVHSNRDNEFPVYADATCAKFNVSGEKCIDNELYTKINEKGVYEDSACITRSTPDTNEYLIITLPKVINIEKIIIYNGDYTSQTNVRSEYKLHPIKIEVFTDSNLNVVAIQNKPKDDLEISTGLPPIPQGVEPDFYETINTGLANYYRGWQNIHSSKNKSFCRFLAINSTDTADDNEEDENEDGTNKKKDVYLSCINPDKNAINLKPEISTSSGNSFDPGVLTSQYMGDETGDNYDDFCRCVKNPDNNSTSLRCVKSDPTKHFYEEFYPPDKFLVNDCKTYTGEELQHMGKLPEYDDCSTELILPISNSIDCSFYNTLNQKYYIFKNIRFDDSKFVLFCEVDKNHNIMSGYPQFVNKRYWGLPEKFLKQIDDTIYIGNNQVVFLSGQDCCVINLNNTTFKRVLSKETNIQKLIPTLPPAYNSNIQTGFFLNDKIRLVKRGRVININALNNEAEQDIIYLDKLIKIPSEFENVIDINYKKINTIFSMYDNEDIDTNQWIYIYTDTDVYKYNLSSQEFSNNDEFNVSKKINELYPSLKWDLPNDLRVVKPSPPITNN